jgi:5-formyltetrahydrofolate cyclo-ligase
MQPLSQLRDYLKQQRANLSADYRQHAEQKILQQFISLSEFQSAQHIAIYLSFQSEVNTQKIIEYAWSKNKKIYLPVMQENKTLSFFLYDQHTPLIKNKWNILEPTDFSKKISVEQLELVIFPLLGFDQHLTRLGYGQGFYDRTFNFMLQSKKEKTAPIGLAFECQRQHQLVRHEWDVPLWKIITEKKSI